MIKFRRKKSSQKSIPFIKLFPNIVTLLGLIIGVNSIRFALAEKWEESLYCIVIATIIDGIDGRVARFLNATSHFGAELDSLCDFVNFGICPGLIIYLWLCGIGEVKLVCWSISMLFMICMAIRLARFNAAISNPKSADDDGRFFCGVPAPSGALLTLMPMIISFKITNHFEWPDFNQHIFAINLYVSFIALLLIAPIPTISLKKLHIQPQYLSLIMTMMAITIIALYIYTWYFLPILAIIYFISIPFCVYVSRKTKLNRNQKNSGESDLLP